MRDCIEPGCPYSAYEERCYFHEKMRLGLFSGRPVVSRHQVMASAVIDDEQRELAGVLEALGADGYTIKNALTAPRRSLTHAPQRGRKEART